MSLEEMNPLHSNGVHVMLVDYDPTSLSKSALVLRQASFKVTPTKIQQVALSLLQEHKGEFNMLITSDQNQEMDCHSFIQRIRLIQEDLPIVVISSLESNVDQGLKTLFDSTCYVIRKPVTENTLWGVWQRHQMRTSLVARRQVHRGNSQLVIQESEISGGNGRVGGQVEYAPFDPKGKAVEREENRKLKRSKPCEDEEEEEDDEVARKKGKTIAEPSKINGRESTKGLRPTFDPQQHKLLMEAISYGGPARHTKMAQYLPSTRQQVPTIAERHSRARAPWTQYLNERLEKARARNNIPGYGVQLADRYKMMYKRLPPSWVSPTNWRARLNSEYLNSATDERVGGIPVSGLSDRYKASTSNNGGLNVAEYQMPMNPNIVSFNGLSSSMLNGMDQNMNHVGTQVTQPNTLVINGFNNGAQDGMRFGSYGHDNSLLSVVYPEQGYTQMEKQLTESINYGQSFASGYPITNLGSFSGVEGNIFQSTNSLLNTTGVELEENVNQEDVNEENVVTWKDLGTLPANQVETIVNEPSKHGSEGEDRTANLNSDVDEFAEFFSFLENDADEGGINSGLYETTVEGDIYFDIDNFELSCGDHQI